MDYLVFLGMVIAAVYLMLGLLVMLITDANSGCIGKFTGDNVFKFTFVWVLWVPVVPALITFHLTRKTGATRKHEEVIT